MKRGNSAVSNSLWWGLTRRLRRGLGLAVPWGALLFGWRSEGGAGGRAESPLHCIAKRQLCRKQFPLAGNDAPTPARGQGLQPYGALTLFFRWRKKSVQKKASGTATLAARPTSHCGQALRYACAWLRASWPSAISGASRPSASLGGGLWSAVAPSGLSSTSVRFAHPSGKKPFIAHFGGGARYVARSGVGQLTPTIVRARSSPFSAVKMGGPFSLRCLSPLCSPAVGVGHTQPLQGFCFRRSGWRSDLPFAGGFRNAIGQAAGSRTRPASREACRRAAVASRSSCMSPERPARLWRAVRGAGGHPLPVYWLRGWRAMVSSMICLRSSSLMPARISLMESIRGLPLARPTAIVVSPSATVKPSPSSKDR